MRKNFTQLISEFRKARHLTLGVSTLFLLILSAAYLKAAVGISITGAASYELNADIATTTFTPITDVVIAEGQNNEFVSGQTYIIRLTAPNGWIFEGSGANALRNTSGEITITSGPSYTTAGAGARSVEFSIRAGNGTQNKLDQITISGLRIRSTNGIIDLTQPKQISVQVITGSTTVASSSPISLSQVAGAPKKLTFISQPVTTETGASIPSFQAAIQDQFGNRVTNATNPITLSIGANPSSGALTAGTSTTANGVVTFSGYSINTAGTGYTLIASGTDLTSATSNVFTINNRQPIIDNIVECLSEGDSETTITITGSNFVSGATVFINNVSRPATVINSTTLTTTVTATELASAGNLSLRVKNPTPASNGGESSIKLLTVERLFKNSNITGDREVCTGERLPYWGGTVFTNYEWSVTEGASILPRTNESIFIQFNDRAPASGLVTVTVSAKNRCGVSSTQSFNVKVNQTPSPTISYDTPLIFCEGGSVILKAPVAQGGESDYIYQWMLGEDVIEGASSATFEAKAPGQYSVVITAESTCAKRSSFVTVSMTTPIIQGEIQGNTTYCQNAAPTALTATVSGGTTAKTYLWEKADNESGPWEAANGINNEISYFPSTAIAGTKFYRRVVTSGGCTSISDPVAVTVTPEITNNTISTPNQTVCSGSVIASLDGVVASGDINVDYLWEQSTTGEANAWTPAEGANDQEDYQPATKSVDETTVTYYRRKVVSGNCTNYSNVVNVKVTSMPDALIKEGPNTYFCSPGTATLTTDAGDNYSYAWFKENGETDLAVGTNNNSIEVGEVGQYYVIVTQVTDGNSCVTISEPITVEETIVNNNIINSQNQTVCYGAVPAPLEGSDAKSSLGTVAYQWQKSTDGVSFDNISDASGVDLVLGIHTTDTWYRRIARVGSCINYNKNPETGEEVIIKVSVLPQIINTLTSADQTICLDGEIQPITGNEVTGGNGSGSYTFIWYQRTGNGSWVVAPGTNSEESYTPQVAGVAGTYSFRRDVVSGTCAPIASSNVVTVTVQPAITGNIIAGATAYCQGAIATALGTDGTVSGGNAGSYTYIWQQSSTGTNGSWGNAAGDFDNETYIPSTATGGTVYYKRLVTSGQCMNDESNVLAVTVTSSIVNNINTTKTAYCQNDTAVPIDGLVAGGNGENTYTFRWEKSETGSNPWIPIEGEEGSSFTPLTSAAGTIYYRRVVTSGNCANKTSEPIAITVNGTITNSISSTSSTYCQNATGAAAIGGVPTGGTGTYTYAWQVKTGESGTWTSIGGNTVNITPSTLQPGEFFYKRIVSSGACTGSESNEFKVTILPAIVNSLSNPAEYSYCQYTSSTALTGTISGGNGSYTYLWQQSTTGTSNWSAASGTNNQESYTPSTATAGTMYYRRTVTSGVCAIAVASNVVKVVVIPTIANNTISGPATVCYGLQPTIITGTIPTNGNGSHTYLWEQSTNGGSTWGPADGANNQQNYQPTALTTTTQYRRTVSAGTCIPNVSSVHTIVVTPLPAKPSITNLKSTYYTGESSFTMQVSPSNSTGRFVYEKETNGVFSEVERTASATFNPCTLGAGTYRVSYTYTVGSCSNTSDPITVTIKQSTYRVVVNANIYPNCRGDKVDYTATVYRDAEVIYPYLANENGVPVDRNNKPLGNQDLVIPNPDYFAQRGIPLPPPIIVANAFRYYQAHVVSGTVVPASSFTYQWTKNQEVYPGSDRITFENAGLSSLDYYAVVVTPNAGAICGPLLNSVSNRSYSANTANNYAITLSVTPNPICLNQSVALKATLDPTFEDWELMKELTINWMVKSGSTTTKLGTTVYNPENGSGLEIVTSGPSGVYPNGGFKDDDEIYIEFTSELNDPRYTGSGKCTGRSTTSPSVKIDVVMPQTMTGGGVYCAGGVGVPVGLTDSEPGVSYQLRRTVDGVTTSVGGPIQGTGNAISFGNQTVAGSYTVQPTTVSGSTCAIYGPVNVYVTPLPTVFTVTGGGEYCATTDATGVPVGLSGSQLGVRYQLLLNNVANGSPIDGTGNPLSFGNKTVPGTYTVIATTISSTTSTPPVAACPRTMLESTTIVANQLPTVTVTNPVQACAGQSATVTATPSGGTGPYTYTWTVPIGWTGDKPTTASFQTTVPGIYTVRVTDSKSCASSAVASSTVTINPLPTVTVNSPTTCLGTTTTVEATVENGTGPYTYTWSVPSGWSGQAPTTASFQTSVGGTYKVVVTDSKGCASASGSGVVTIKQAPAVSSEITMTNAKGVISPSNPIMKDEDVTFTVFTNIPSTDVRFYSWYIGNDDTGIWSENPLESGPNVTSITYKPTTNEPFDIKVEISTTTESCYGLIKIVSDNPITPLPVELIYFKAARRDNAAVLTWATASEKNNEGFEVQVSQDGRNYRQLQFVPSQNGNTSIKQTYEFVDKENGKHGTRYYRLKQLDSDGKYKYYGPVAVAFGDVSNKVLAYPNPFEREVKLDVDAEKDAVMEIVVTSLMGKQVMKQEIAVKQGKNTTTLDLGTDLPAGVYIVTTRFNGTVSNFKLLKQ